MNLDAIGVVHVVRHRVDGNSAVRHLVVDGQHRVLALHKLDLGDWPVDVMIHTEADTSAKASQLFLDLNNRAAVRPYDRFLNEVNAKDPSAVGITKLVNKMGYVLRDTAGDGHICCVSSMKRVWGIDDGKTLSTVLTIAQSSWGTIAESVDGRVVDGLAEFVTRYKEGYDQAALVHNLAKYPGGPTALIGAARGLRAIRSTSIARCVAELVVEAYNLRRKSSRLEPL